MAGCYGDGMGSSAENCSVYFNQLMLCMQHPKTSNFLDIFLIKGQPIENYLKGKCFQICTVFENIGDKPIKHLFYVRVVKLEIHGDFVVVVIDDIFYFLIPILPPHLSGNPGWSG